MIRPVLLLVLLFALRTSTAEERAPPVEQDSVALELRGESSESTGMTGNYTVTKCEALCISKGKKVGGRSRHVMVRLLKECKETVRDYCRPWYGPEWHKYCVCPLDLHMACCCQVSP